MNHLKITLLILLTCAFAKNMDAQLLWQDIEASRIPDKGMRYITPKEFKTYALNENDLKKVLEIAPLEDTKAATLKPAYFSMPMPDGTMRNFEIVNSPVMAAELGAKYPEIQTYSGYDIQNPANTARFDLTPQGFHAMIFTQEFGTVYIDPYSFDRKGYYTVYKRKDFRSALPKNFECGVLGDPIDISGLDQSKLAETPLGDCTKRTYRLAVAATGEYTAFHGGTQALAIAAQVTTMNRVNGVYMRDMAIFMEIVANNDVIVYTNANNDPYTNGNPGSMINQVQTDCDNNIGSNNYDIGHVFGTNSGGLAGLGVICSNGNKASGVTGSSAPVGDPFDIDYVAHEIGHQFGCNHTFNNSCGGNRNTSTAYEPGSGSTIMAYAGICPPNVQSNSDDHFHIISLQEMSNEILSTSCPVLTPLSNTAPTINNVPTGLTIPGGTPFEMTADATDAEGDPMTYCWEQMDREISTQSPVSTSTNGPNFRSNPPVTDPTRYFPNLPDVLAGNSPTWEVLATVDRVFNFRVTVRDNATGGGCSVYESAVIDVDGDSGPFLVQNPNTGGIVWTGNTNEAVTWDVAGTNNAPVNCANVDIFLSLDGGQTYPITIATNTPNDGSESITVPNNASTTARVKVVCSDNVFYDISNNNFTINTGCVGCPTCSDGIQNGNETEVDCGGPDCQACPTCNDGIQNGDEVGVDCGGPDCSACPAENCSLYDFTNTVVSYDNGGNDEGTATVQDAGATVFMTGNAWKAITINYTVTPNTVMEFDFKSPVEGEIHEVAFDNDLAFAPENRFVIYGSQNYSGNFTNQVYSGSGNYEHFVLELGANFTGTFTYLVLTADDDANAIGESYFSNIQIYEDANGNLMCDDNACPSIISLTSPVPTGVYTAGDEINCNSSVDGTSNVSFQAGNIIKLENGFETPASTDFEAIIQGCQPN